MAGLLCEGQSRGPEFPVWKHIKSLDLPGLRDPGPIRVDCVGVGHALRNVVFMLCTAALLALLPLLCVVVGILAAVIGLFTTNWDACGCGVPLVVMTPLAVIAAVLMIVVLWFALLFQPCTPAYAVLWLVGFGLPFAALGAAGGTAPTVTVIVIVK